MLKKKNNSGCDLSINIPYFYTSLPVSHFSMLNHIQYLYCPLLFCSLCYSLSPHTSHPHYFYPIIPISITNSISDCPVIRDVVSLSTKSLQRPCSNWWNLPSQTPNSSLAPTEKWLAFSLVTCRETSSQYRRNCKGHLACIVEDGPLWVFCQTKYDDFSLLQRQFVQKVGLRQCHQGLPRQAMKCLSRNQD